MDAVTGAFGYTGRHVAERLLRSGRAVRTLTNHPDPADPLHARIEVVPLALDDPAALARSLEGVDTLYSTYWVRFPRGGVGFDDAVARNATIFAAARRAGVRRVVHFSVTNCRADSPLPYYRGKALVEDALRGAGLSYAIVRPTLAFGGRDILVNNIAWLLRRFPLFVVPGDGRYRVRPIHVDDIAALAVAVAGRDDDLVVDAAGPDVLAFDDLVRALAGAVRSRAVLVHAPPAVALAAVRAIGALVRDVVLTRDELAGLMGEYLVTSGPATGTTRFADWLARDGAAVGRRYASELERHFRPA